MPKKPTRRRNAEALLPRLAETLLGWSAARWLSEGGCAPADGKSYPFFIQHGEGELIVFDEPRKPGRWFAPFADAGDDYAVLEAVRETAAAPDGPYLDFARALSKIWKQRTPGIIYPSLAYKPGDYTLAVASVIGATYARATRRRR